MKKGLYGAIPRHLESANRQGWRSFPMVHDRGHGPSARCKNKKAGKNRPCLSDKSNSAYAITFPASLGFSDIDRLWALLTLFYLEHYFLAFAKGLETRALNGAEMNENIRPAIYFDKAIPFLLVEPLYSTFRHCRFLSHDCWIAVWCVIGATCGKVLQG